MFLKSFASECLFALKNPISVIIVKPADIHSPLALREEIPALGTSDMRW